MCRIHEQLLTRLCAALAPSQRAAVQLLAQRVRIAAGGGGNLGRFRVLVGCTGGKDSLQALAFLRAAQLNIARSHPRTFILRVALCRPAGAHLQAFDNLMRACDALFLQEDHRVELLLHEGQELTLLGAADAPPAPNEAAEVQVKGEPLDERLNLLVSGHLSGGNERVMFGNGHYLAMAATCQRALAWGGQVGAMVVAEPPRRLRHYLAWGLRAARQAGLPAHAGNLMAALEGLADAYYRELHGRPIPPPSGLAAGARAAVELIGLHDVLEGHSPEHWRLLTDFLGYRYLGLDSACHELDSARPSLLAHLHGLRCEYLRGKGYPRGVHDYLRAAVPLLRSRGMPEAWIRRSLAEWHGDSGTAEQRALANQDALAGYGIDEGQWVCMLFAPFVGHGAGLKHYLQVCHPQRLPALAELHGALQGQPATARSRAWLTAVSGLSAATLRRLYHLPALAQRDGRPSLLAGLLASDPQRYLRPPAPLTGPAVRDLIAGRS